MATERVWSRLGEVSPYWAVCVDPRFEAGALTAEQRKAFFESGEADVRATFDVALRIAGETFRPRRALDFGCGVGRLTMPIARRSDRVVAVDISEPMLTEAEKNCRSHDVANVEFRTTDAWLAESSATFDFVHSFIVFQHIPPQRGLRLTETLLTRLEPGGVMALHYTFARRASIARKAVNRLRRWVPPVDWMIKLVRGEPLRRPSIPMYHYDASRLLARLQQHGFEAVSLSFTDHGGHLGAMIVGRKPGSRVTR